MAGTIGIVILSYFLFSLVLPIYFINLGLGWIMFAWLAMIASLLLTVNVAKAYISANKTLPFVIIQFSIAVIGAVVLYFAGLSIRDASLYPFMALGFVIFLCLNLIVLIIIKLGKKFGEKLAIGLIIVLVSIPNIYFIPRSIDVSKMKALEQNREIQFIYRYKDNIYYTSNRFDGIYRMSVDGETMKIQNTPRMEKITNVTFWVDSNFAYFKDKYQWHSINLDTGEVCDNVNVQVDHEKYFDRRHEFLGGGQQKVGYIKHSQVTGDGYIYFSTYKGFYRTKLNDELNELLIEGRITLFDIQDGTLQYYDINKTPHINKVQLPVPENLTQSPQSPIGKRIL